MDTKEIIEVQKQDGNSDISTIVLIVKSLVMWQRLASAFRICCVQIRISFHRKVQIPLMLLAAK
jgi:hypothetical protein